MTVVHFYEKPGCLTNAKQKKLLAAAGYMLVVHNLLDEAWGKKPEKLRNFFGALPIPEWFNPSSPNIKNGTIDPTQLDETQAIKLMVKQPLLIRRPLIEIDGHCMVGFDCERLNKHFDRVISSSDHDMTESCSKQAKQGECR